MKIDSREVLLKSVELFLNRENIKHIQVVFSQDSMEESRKKFSGHLGLFGVKITISTGAKWIDQWVAAAEKLPDDVTHVIVHDGARPAVPYNDIEALLEAGAKHAAVALVAPVRNALLELDPGGAPVSMHLPAEMVQLLTPQAFTLAKFREIAGSKSDPHPSAFTIVKGSGLNVRVGGAHDASLVSAMLRLLPKPKVRGPNNPFEEAQW